MIDALVKIIATNHGTNWWRITNCYLYKEIFDILDWGDIVYTKDDKGIWFEHDLQHVEIAETIEMLEKLRLLYGLNHWPKIKNVTKT